MTIDKLSISKDGVIGADKIDLSKIPIFENTIDIDCPYVIKLFLKQKFIKKIYVNHLKVLNHYADLLLQDKILRINYDEKQIKIDLNDIKRLSVSLTSSFFDINAKIDVDTNDLFIKKIYADVKTKEYGDASIDLTILNKNYNSFELNAKRLDYGNLTIKLDYINDLLKANISHKFFKLNLIGSIKNLKLDGSLFKEKITGSLCFKDLKNYNLKLNTKGIFNGEIYFKNMNDKIKTYIKLNAYKINQPLPYLPFSRACAEEILFEMKDEKATIKTKNLKLGSFSFQNIKGDLLLGKKSTINIMNDGSNKIELEADLLDKQLNIKKFYIKHKKSEYKLNLPLVISKNNFSKIDISVCNGKVVSNQDIYFKNVPFSSLSLFYELPKLEGTFDGIISLNKNSFFKFKNLKAESLNSQKDSPLFGEINFSLKNQSVSAKIKSENNKTLTIRSANNSLNLNGEIPLHSFSFLIPASDYMKGTGKFHNFNISKNSTSGKFELNGFYEIGEFGTTFKDCIVEGYGKGDYILMTKIAANDSKKGSLIGYASIKLNGKLDAKIKATNYIFTRNDQIFMKGDCQFFANGNGLLSAITGDVNLKKSNVNLDEFETTPILKLKIKKPHKIKTEKIPYFPIDIAINSEKIKISGIGLKSIFKGNLKAKGPILDPYLIGDIYLHSGSLEIFGKKMKLTQAKISYTDSKKNDPYLFLEAFKDVSDVKIIFRIEGHSSSPKMTFISQPAYSEEEAISFLLFGKGVGKLTAGQGLQLASALSPFKKGVDIINSLRSSLGIDIDFVGKDEYSDKNAQSINLQKEINEIILLSLEGSSDPHESKASIKWSLTPWLSLSADVGGSHSSGLGINMEKRYE